MADADWTPRSASGDRGAGGLPRLGGVHVRDRSDDRLRRGPHAQPQARARLSAEPPRAPTGGSASANTAATSKRWLRLERRLQVDVDVAAQRVRDRAALL